jgi:hypothetical protein
MEDSKDLLLRPLDCMIIEQVHDNRKKLVDEGRADYEFNTVRAVFMEWDELYENAGFRDKNHIQICVRNPNCIKGYFRVVKSNGNYRIP